LEETLDQDPRELGYRFAIWTVERLRDHLRLQMGVEMSVKRLGEIILERGYVYRRPKHDLKNLQDPEAKAQAEQRLEELKKGARAAFPARLCGRNRLEPASSIAQVLDEARSAKDHSHPWRD
jgi:hypothetical protein